MYPTASRTCETDCTFLDTETGFVSVALSILRVTWGDTTQGLTFATDLGRYPTLLFWITTLTKVYSICNPILLHRISSNSKHLIHISKTIEHCDAVIGVVVHQNGLGSDIGKILGNHPSVISSSRVPHPGTHRGDGRRGERSMGREREESVGMAISQEGSQEPEEGYRSLSTWFPHG